MFSYLCMRECLPIRNKRIVIDAYVRDYICTYVRVCGLSVVFARVHLYLRVFVQNLNRLTGGL